MYYVIVGQTAVGPFINRDLAYSWAGKNDLKVSEYVVASQGWILRAVKADHMKYQPKTIIRKPDSVRVVWHLLPRN